jgi:hypothetical protein
MAIFAVLLVLALLWLALLYLGIPLGIVGCCIAAYLFKPNPEATDDLDQTEVKQDRRNALILVGVSMAIVVASLVGNYFNKDGPLHDWLNGQTQPATSEQGED